VPPSALLDVELHAPNHNYDGDTTAPLLAVGLHRGDLVIDVELEEVGDGHDEAGLADAGRAVD